MRIARATVVLALLSAMMVVCMSSAVSGTTVHRLVQYDVESETLGARRTSMSQTARRFTTADASYSRSVVVITAAEAVAAGPDTIAWLATNSSAAGLVVVLPAADELAAVDVSQWVRIERRLTSKQAACPVYFVSAGDASMEATATGLSDQTVAVSGAEAHSVGGKAQGSTFEGRMGATRAPTLVIAGAYDRLCVAPSLGDGGESAAVVAGVLTVARHMAELYADQDTQGDHQVVVLLTAGSAVDHAGVKAWLAGVESRLVKRIEMVLYVDSLPVTAEDGLFLHVAATAAASPALESLSTALSAAADAAAVPFEVVTKDRRRKHSNAVAAPVWGHARFAQKNLPAVTLSRHAAPHLVSALDATVAPQTEAVARGVRVLVQAVTAHIYGASALGLVGSSAVDTLHITTVLDQWAAQPTSAADLVDPKGPRVEISMLLANELQRELAPLGDAATVNVDTQYAVDTPVSLYTVQRGLTLTTGASSSLLVEIVCLVAAIAYLLGLFAAIGGVSSLLQALNA